MGNPIAGPRTMGIESVPIRKRNSTRMQQAVKGCIRNALGGSPAGLANQRAYVQKVAFSDGHVLGQMSRVSHNCLSGST